MSKIEILHRSTGAVLFALDEAGATIIGAVEAAVKSGADLIGADLRGADMRGANLRDCDLRDCDLRDCDLRDCDLRVSDLRGADLRGAYLLGEKLSRSPIMIDGLQYQVTITAESMAIGCQRHTHAEWEGFDLDKIEAMDNGAWETWEQYREPLLALCKLHKEVV